MRVISCREIWEENGRPPIEFGCVESADIHHHGLTAISQYGSPRYGYCIGCSARMMGARSTMDVKDSPHAWRKALASAAETNSSVSALYELRRSVKLHTIRVR